MAKIAIVATDSWYVWNFRKTTINRLINEGHKVTVYCDNLSYLDKLEALGACVEYLQLGGRRLRPVHEFLTLMLFGKKLWTDRPDILMSFNPKGNLYVGLWRKVFKFGWIANISGLGVLGETSGWRSRLVSLLFRFAFKRVDHVFFQNNADLENWVASNIVLPHRASRQYGTGVNLDEFSPVLAPSGPLEIVCIARLLTKKGIGEFIQLAKLVRSQVPGVNFLLAGSIVPPEEGGFSKNKIDAAAKKGHIRFLGMLDDVRPVLAGRTVGCLLTSYKEGIPRSMIEFLAIGRPILISKFNGAIDLVPNSRNGQIVDLSSQKWIDEAATFIIKICQDPSYYDALCASSLSIAKQKFDGEVGINEYIDHINQLLR